MLNKLKYSCCFFICVCTFAYVNGQTKLLSPGEMLPGVWQWTNGKDTFTIQLFRIDTSWKSKVNDTEFGPNIYGWHRYVENGVLIESSFPESLYQKPFSKGIFGGIMNTKDIYLWFRDITRDRDFRVEAEFLDSAGTLMRWTTHRPQERVWYPPPKPKIWDGQTIPSSVILHKMPETTTTALNKPKEMD